MFTYGQIKEHIQVNLSNHLGTWFKNKMHGNGCIVWSDGRKYIGVIYYMYDSNIKMIENMVMEYFSGLTEENMLDVGKGENKMA